MDESYKMNELLMSDGSSILNLSAILMNKFSYSPKIFLDLLLRNAWPTYKFRGEVHLLCLKHFICH